MFKNKSKILIAFILIVLILSSISQVFAITINSSGRLQYLRDSSYNWLSLPIKMTDDGRYAYCMEHSKPYPTRTKL